MGRGESELGAISALATVVSVCDRVVLALGSLELQARRAENTECAFLDIQV